MASCKLSSARCDSLRARFDSRRAHVRWPHAARPIAARHAWPARSPARAGLDTYQANRGDDGHRQQQQQRDPAECRQGGIAAAPAPQPARDRRPSRRNRLPIQQPAQVVGQVGCRGVAVPWVKGRGLQDDGLQVLRQVPRDLSRTWDALMRDAAHQLLRVAVGERAGRLPSHTA